MPNIQNNLILIKGEDKTAAIQTWQFDKYKPVVFITYSNGKSYPYNTSDVLFLKNPRTVQITDRIVEKDGSVLFGVLQIQYFDDYCRINYKTGYTEICRTNEIRLVDSALNNPVSRNCFEYLKQLAIKIGLVQNGQNILASRYDKIDFIREDSVLASFLSGKVSQKESRTNDTIVFPFGFNLSQKEAVRNALDSSISIIDGPPGTGKTQTILNIIANVVMHGESVAVVSSNNSATANVLEKLQKSNVGFIAAPLGNSENKSSFITNQTAKLPDMSSWVFSTAEIAQQLKTMYSELNRMLALKNEQSEITAEQEAISKEMLHFSDYYSTVRIDSDMPTLSTKLQASKILSFIAESEAYSSEDKKPGNIQKLKWLFQYGSGSLRMITKPFEMANAYCQNLYYHKRMAEIDKRLAEINSELSVFDFEGQMKKYTELSMRMFKASLAKKYASHGYRKTYQAEDLWKEPESFINDYPVVLSTTYSLRSSLSSRFIYDYVIVDESSQVDIATGALALSCAKKAVIVGDLKQLPNIVNAENKKVTDDIFQGFHLGTEYRYSDHSLLSSVLELFPDAPHVLLKEHYRCHPEIIGFCNKRFYNDELIILTKPKNDIQPMTVYRTAAGNMARGHINQRQIDVIKNEVFPNLHLNPDDGSVGIVTPYRDQANELQKAFAGTKVKADTADKFQGQERSVIIFSTVDNEIGEFASDPNRLNVAVSRAIDRFIVVTDGNDNDQTSPIHELIGYIQYQNHDIINSEIHSVFDYLYQKYADARQKVLIKYGRISEVDSENLMYSVIRDVLSSDEFNKFDVAAHVPLRMLLSDLQKLDTRELMFAANHLTHVDFLIFSKLTHQPILVIEVDGYSFHTENEKQKERDTLKNNILQKYQIPILRLSTTGSGEKEKLENALQKL